MSTIQALLLRLETHPLETRSRLSRLVAPPENADVK